MLVPEVKGALRGPLQQAVRLSPSKECGATDLTTTDSLAGGLKQASLPHLAFYTLCHFCTPHHLPNLPELYQETNIADLAAHAAMSPFQNSHQPTHAGQPAGAFSFAPEEEPALLPFDGEALPSDFAFMDAPGFWDHEIASQNAFDSGLNEPWMMPTFSAEGGLFDYTWNYQTNEPLGFEGAFSTQSALGPALNGQMMLPPFDPTLWMGQSFGQVASTSALFPGQAPIAPDGAPSYPQDASFDCFHSADWTNEDAGMPDALGPADPIR
jgi:hypothetical protein